MNVVIDGKNIFRVDHTNTKTECIGVIADEYLQMKQDAEDATELAERFHKEKEEYLDLLVEHGLKERPKTQEQINEELANKLKQQEELNIELLSAVQKLTKRLEGIDNEHIENKRPSTRAGDGRNENKPGDK